MAAEAGARITVSPLTDSPSARSSWLDFVAECFAAKGTPRAYFASQLERDAAAGRAGTVVVARQDGKLVSTAKIFGRWVRFGAGGVRYVAGIGAVCTALDGRDQGFATLVLEYLMRTCVAGEERGFSMSLLHAREKYREFYRARG